MVRVCIAPKFGNSKTDYGGIKRVCDAQIKWLPEWGIEVVDNKEQADVYACHATAWINDDKPTVSHCHGLYWSNYQWPKWAEKVNDDVTRVLKKAVVSTVPSQWVADAIARYTNIECKVIGHGVDLDEWPEVNSNQNREYVLWNKTRIDPVCDPRPVNVLARMLPKSRFLTTLGEAAANVELIGVQSYNEHKPFIQHAGLYLATARETFGIGILEAMACGVPVIGWDWGSDIVEHKKTGWLSPVGDYQDLVKGLTWCIQHRDELSVNCRQVVVERYQWQDVIKQYADLYERVASERRSKYEIKVSVIIPSHNLRNYLPAAIESVLKQDYEKDKYELLIVDDCSTDGSYELACELTGSNASNARVIKTPNNLYLAGALNYGISKAKGDYILCLDADNRLAPGALSTLAGELDRNSNIDIAYGKVRFVNDDGSAYKSQITDEQGISRWPPDHFSYDQQMMHHNQIPSTCMYRRRVWERIGGYRRRCRTAEDADFWCRATTFMNEAAKVTQAVTFTYTVRSESMSHVQSDWPWEQWYTNLTTRKPQATSPVISVIIPVGPGHGDQGIIDALDSVLNQSFKDWECIVVDDTGKRNNNTSEIRWLPSLVRYYHTDSPGSGASVSRNIGISRCKGSAFVLLDADDYLASDALEKMYHVWVQAKDKYIYTDWFKGHDGGGRAVTEYSFAGTLRALQHPITCLYPVGVRDIVKFDESLSYGEDWDYILKLMTNGFCGIRVPEPLVYYRQSSGNNRNKLYENIEGFRALMQERYGSMACGCKSEKSSAINIEKQLGVQRGELVLVEYTGQGGPITYRGPKTGTEYRVGSDEGHRLKYVHKSDAEWFLSRSEFRLADLATVS